MIGQIEKFKRTARGVIELLAERPHDVLTGYAHSAEALTEAQAVAALAAAVLAAAEATIQSLEPPLS